MTSANTEPIHTENGDEKPLAPALGPIMAPEAGNDDYLTMVGGEGGMTALVQTGDGRVLRLDLKRLVRMLVDEVVKTEYEWAKDKLHSEQEGEKFSAMVSRVDRRFHVSDDIYNKVDALDKMLRKVEVDRMHEERNPLVKLDTNNNFGENSVNMMDGNNSLCGNQNIYKP